MKVLDKANASTCLITSDVEFGGKTAACGVFIDKDIVLTAWHVVANKRNFNVMNAEGFKSGIKPGSRIYQTRSQDAAIIQLEQPIGKHFLHVVSPDDAPTIADEAWIVSRFDGIPEVNFAKFDADAAPVYCRNREEPASPGRPSAVFHCAADSKIGPGYSGSPIINRDGRIISVLSGGLSETWAYVSGQSKRIGGAPPTNLAKFVEAFRR